MEELEQLSTIIEQRRKVVTAIAEEWNLPTTLPSQKAVYHLLDMQAFENPLTLIQTLFSYIGTQKPALAQELIAGFFFPTGIMKDFAHYNASDLQEYILPHAPTPADLDQLYVLNLFLIMANSPHPDLICNTYASISEWEQMQAPTNWCEIVHRPMPPAGSCMPNFPDPASIKRPCEIVPKQPLKTCGTGKFKEPLRATPCGTSKLKLSKIESGKQCNHGGFPGKKQKKTQKFPGSAQTTLNAFRPKDFENFEVDFPEKDTWEKEGKEILRTINQIPPEEVDQEKIEKFLKAALGKSWGHIFSEGHKKRGVLGLGSSQEEIIQILRMIIRQLHKANMLKIANNHIDTTINSQVTYIKIFLHPNGLPYSIDCYKQHPEMGCRKIGNIIEWLP